MKKLTVLSVLLSLAVAIVLPATSNGKYDVSKPAVADGNPMPPPIPPSPSGMSMLMADGNPMPPPIPPNPSVYATLA